MAPNETVNHFPESVSKLCVELQTISAKVLEMRTKARAQGGAPQLPQERDIDHLEGMPIVADTGIQSVIMEGVRTGGLLLSSLKQINRSVYQQEHNLRNELMEQKLSVGKVDLGYQNINYQRKYLKSEIARCHDMETFYQDVPLVPLEEFRQTAPEHLNNATDENQLMMNRLQFELEERKRFDAEKRRLLAVKVQLTKANKARKAQIAKVEKQLEAYIQSSQSLQNLFQEPVVPVHSHSELLASTATATATTAASSSTLATTATTEPGMGVSSPRIPSDELMNVSLSQDGRSSPSLETGEAAGVAIVAPIRYGTTELMKRNDVAQLLPQPLYVLFRHACAFSATFGEEVRAEIQGDVQAAQVEARVLATAQRAGSSTKAQSNGTIPSKAIEVLSADSPSLQREALADEDEGTSKDRRGSDSSTRNTYERFPLDVVIKIKKDALANAHTIVHLRFGYLTRLGVVVVAVEAAPGILKFDPSLILQELFPRDTGEVCPNPEAAFLGMSSYDTLVSSDGTAGEQSSDLVLDTKKAGGYAFRWAQEICGLEFLGPLSQGWGIDKITGAGAGAGAGEDLVMSEEGSSSAAVLSGIGNRRAFLSQVIRMIRNRRRAWKALERQLEDLERSIIPAPKHKAGWDVRSEDSSVAGLLIQLPVFDNPRSKITILGWRPMEGGSNASGSKYSSLYSVQFMRPDPLLSSRAMVSAKVVIVEATVEIALAYADRRPLWELKPGPGFPESMRTKIRSSRSRNSLVKTEDAITSGMPVDESMEGEASLQPSPKSEEEPEEEIKEGSPHLDTLMTAVNVEIPMSLYRAEPGDRNMMLSIQITKIVQDLAVIMGTAADLSK